MWKQFSLEWGTLEVQLIVPVFFVLVGRVSEAVVQKSEGADGSKDDSQNTEIQEQKVRSVQKK